MVQATTAISVGNKDFEIFPLRAKQHLVLFKKLISVLGPSLAVFSNMDMDAEIDTDKIVESIKLFSINCPDSQFESFLDDILLGVKLDNKNINIDIVFQEKPFDALVIAGHVIKERFLSDFLGATGFINK